MIRVFKISQFRKQYWSGLFEHNRDRTLPEWAKECEGKPCTFEPFEVKGLRGTFVRCGDWIVRSEWTVLTWEEEND